jgi:uncharacterized membrane protein (DUF106 family)
VKLPGKFSPLTTRTNLRRIRPAILAPTVPVLTTKQMVQVEVASTLVDAFVNMLFSNDSQANAQKQKMMAELQARQAEAERQRQYQEALRLATSINKQLGGSPSEPPSCFVHCAITL